jgi:REJ domain
MSVGTVYAFSLVALNNRGDSDSQVVKVACTSPNGALVTITSLGGRFNCKAKLVVTAVLTSAYPVSSSWSVVDSMGVAVPFAALTPISRNFSSVNTISQVTYALGIQSGVFAAGKSFTFRITAFPSDSPAALSFSEVVLTANSPPSAGYIYCIPSFGVALQTSFLILSPGWTTDSSSFPLSYSFSYRLSPAAVSLVITTRSLRAFVSSSLPAGLPSFNSSLTLQIEVVDIFYTSGTASTEVVVTEGSPDVPDYLSNGLKTAFLAGNVDLAFQSINNVRLFFNIFFHSPRICPYFILS